MMKKVYYGGLMMLALGVFTACGTNEEVEETQTEVEVITGEYGLNAEESDLTWTGKWVGGESDGKEHFGTINITEGNIVVDGETYEGNFTIDMNSIVNIDLTDEIYNGKLINHLKSDDFLNVEEFPTTTVKIEADDTGSAYIVVSAFGFAFQQGAPIKATISEENVTLQGEFTLDFSGVKMPGMQEDPEAPENGSVSSEVKFVLNVTLDKK